MSPSVFAPLVSLSGVRLHPGVDQGSLDEFERYYGIKLPIDHRSALKESNGMQAYGGYFRLFGVGSGTNVDICSWNNPNCWKFAWEYRCSDFMCFAETAWGDQYAYNIPALMKGNSQVYFLDCLSMTPTVVASSFTDFFENEFVRSAENPYDVMIKEARQVLGDLKIGKHIIYNPSPLLGGAEESANIQIMEARTAMICNGDIAIQLDAGPADGSVRTVTPYEDREGRMRLQLTWV